ncbi:hypothetical protein C0995_003563, partial [Termitomyces sp. Mi166
MESARADSPLTELEGEEISQVTMTTAEEDNGSEVYTSQDSLDNENVFTQAAHPCTSVRNLQKMNISAAPEEHCRRTMGKATHQQELSQEQVEAISLARDKMTVEQRQLVDQHNRNLNVQPGDQNADRAGPWDKGKGPDPHNWGEANLSGDELDPEVQRQILDTCNTQRDQGEGPDNTEEAAITLGNVVIMTGKAAPPTHDELRERL